MEPSGWLAVELDQYFSDAAALDDAALVDALVGFERLAAWAQAKQARLIVELAVRRDEAGGVTDWAADEVAAALHLSSRTAAFRTGFAGCRRTAGNGEVDHLIPYPTGPTSKENLFGYCVHHHHLKHQASWRVRALPDGGLEWITPSGHATSPGPTTTAATPSHSPAR